MSLPVFIPLNVVMLFISVSTPYLQGTVSDVLGLSALGLFMAIACLTMERLNSPVSLFLDSEGFAIPFYALISTGMENEEMEIC